MADIYTDNDLESKFNEEQLANMRFRFIAEPDIPLSIESETGIIRTAAVIDREEICPSRLDCDYPVDVIALVPDPVTILRIIKTIVTIQDLNDNTPTFPESHISKQISELVPVNSNFPIPSAEDLDSGDNAIQSYNLIGGDDKFRLDVRNKVDGSVEVKLVLHEALDREQQDRYDLKVVAQDAGTTVNSGSVDVEIIVLDANDNEPIFDEMSYEVTIPEGTPPGTTLLQVQATDQDAGPFGEITYGFSSNTINTYGTLFTINNITGVITTLQEMDYEHAPVYHLTVTAKDQDPESIPTDTTVIIRVEDINDNAPQITVNTLTDSGRDVAEIAESSDINAFVAYVTVVDQDNGRNGLFSCSLNDNHFRMEQQYDTEYQIVTQAYLDREGQSEYNLAVMCEDSGDQPQVSIKHIHVRVTDVNDNEPVFSSPTYTANVQENLPAGTFVLQVNATDQDQAENGAVYFHLEPANMSQFFELKPQSGILLTRVMFDHETTPQFTMKAVAVDGGDPALSSKATITVNVNDVNDESPTFSQNSYSYSVPEHESVGKQVGVVHAVDHDSPPYNDFEYSLQISYAAANKFQIDPKYGNITTRADLDREEQSIYYLVVVATDHGYPPLTSSASVSIYISDKNDNAPMFEYPSQYNNTLYISNAVPPGYVITRVRAVDRDIGQNANLTYHIASGNDLAMFGMDLTKGTLIVNRNLRDIEYQVFELIILVQDQGIPEKTAAINLNVVVNHSLVYQEEEHQGLGDNFTIVVTMATISAIVVIILIIAIVLLRKQDNYREHRKYIEASKIVKSTTTDTELNSLKGVDNLPCNQNKELNNPHIRNTTLHQDLSLRIPSVSEQVRSKSNTPQQVSYNGYLYYNKLLFDMKLQNVWCYLCFICYNTAQFLMFTVLFNGPLHWQFFHHSSNWKI